MAENTAPTTPSQTDLVSKTRDFLAAQGQPVPPIPAQSQSTATTPAPSVAGMTNVADALYTKGIIDEQGVKDAKLQSVTGGQTLEQVIVSKGLATDAQIAQTKAEMQGIGYADLSAITIDLQVMNKIPQDQAARNKAVAFEETENRVKVAMVDPLDLQKVQFIESFIKKKVDAYYASPSAIQQVIDTKYGAQIGAEVTQAMEDVEVIDLGRNDQVADLTDQNIGNAPVAKIVNMILDYAVKHGASDIHIEPREAKVSVRFRVQGILAEKLTIPPKLSTTIVSRIKILSSMKIDEHRVPQDGRFQVKAASKIVDIRVSVVPSVYGEKVVMRLLEKGSGVISLEETGMRGPAYKLYKEALERTQGIVLITGPTGSGKTVTLASSLAILNKQEVNIMTVEDPVEIRIDGITQVQVNADVGLTFAKGLRSFLRQDPDIIMVGEIRDEETAELAIQAALTGHLVLATLHTNSAAGALPRLLDMGVQPFLLSSTINVIGAQRLVRTLCNDCKQAYEAPEEVMQLMHKQLDGLGGFDLHTYPKKEKLHFDSATKTATLYKAVGCPKCGDSGYTGRIGIFEIMSVSQKIGQMIMSHLSANEIHRQAVSEGMITMSQDGFMKVLEGVTSLEEVLRVQNT